MVTIAKRRIVRKAFLERWRRSMDSIPAPGRGVKPQLVGERNPRQVGQLRNVFADDSPRIGRPEKHPSCQSHLSHYRRRKLLGRAFARFRRVRSRAAICKSYQAIQQELRNALFIAPKNMMAGSGSGVVAWIAS